MAQNKIKMILQRSFIYALRIEDLEIHRTQPTVNISSKVM